MKTIRKDTLSGAMPHQIRSRCGGLLAGQASRKSWVRVRILTDDHKRYTFHGGTVIRAH